MKIMKNLLLIILIAISLYSQSQDIQIYHGIKDRVQLVDNDPKIIRKKKCRFYEGEKVNIQVINAHPGLYKYEIITEEVEVPEPELPENIDIVKLVSGKLELPDENDTNAGSGSRISNNRKDWQDLYKEKIELFYKWMSEADTIITDSDEPLDMDELKNSGGFVKAQERFNKTNWFTKDLDDIIGKLQKEVEQESNYNVNNQQHVLSKNLYDTYLKTLLAKAKNIQKAYGESVHGTFEYTYKVNNKSAKIKLKISKLSDKATARETGDSVIVIDIIPYYNRPIVELVPVAVIAQPSNGKTYGIENGLITGSNYNDVKYGIGASLNINMLNWGPRKEISWAAGLGFTIMENDFDNLFFNTSINLGKWIRIGIGYGWLSTPTGLKNGLTVGSDASNIENIDDVINYSKEKALFFTIVLPGLNLPILK